MRVWIKHTSLGASIDVSMKSVLRKSWPGLPALGHDSEFKRRSIRWISEVRSGGDLNKQIQEEGILVAILSLSIISRRSIFRPSTDVVTSSNRVEIELFSSLSSSLKDSSFSRRLPWFSIAQDVWDGTHAN